MKNFLTIIGLAAVLTVAVSCNCSGGSQAASEDETATLSGTDKMAKQQLPDEPVFDIVTNFGTIKVRLYSKTPQHRANFIKLAEENYYAGMRFHRIINGFMIQCGDPQAKDTTNFDKWGTGDIGYTVPAEFVTEYYHKKGALAAARKGDAANPKKASSGSHFYLVQDEYACLQLDGEYTVFGETVEGLDVIDKIAAVPTDRMDRPLQDVMIIKIVLDPDLNKEPGLDVEMDMGLDKE